MKSILLSSIIFLYVMTAMNSTKAQVQYQVIDLGTLGGNSSRAYDINELTQIVGVAKNNSGEDRAFLWQDGNMINLETLEGDFSWAYGLNNAGQVVGQTNLNNGSYRAFLWQNGMMENLGTSWWRFKRSGRYK